MKDYLRIQWLHCKTGIGNKERSDVVEVGGAAQHCHHLPVLLHDLHHLPGGGWCAVSEEGDEEGDIVHLVEVRSDCVNSSRELRPVTMAKSLQASITAILRCQRALKG